MSNEELLMILVEFEKQHNLLNSSLISEIKKSLKDGVSLSNAIDTATNSGKYFTKNDELIIEGICKAAILGYGAETLGPLKEKLKKSVLNTTWDSDGMKLSDRLHNNRQNMRQAIIDSMSASVKNQETVAKMAKGLYDGYNSGKNLLNDAELPDYMKRLEVAARRAADGNVEAFKEYKSALKSAEKEIEKFNARNQVGTPNTTLMNGYKAVIKSTKSVLDETSKFNEKALDKAVDKAVNAKSKYYATRIARTESARAWFEGFIARYENDDEVFGYKWQLSSRHSLVPFDICDVCANADIGYGKGIYPKDKVPKIPQHPHCMCMLRVVYWHEIDSNYPESKTAPEYNPNKAKEYIDQLSDKEKVSLFGSDGLKEYKKGGDWQKLLKDWDGLTAPVSRLDEDDFPTNSLTQEEETAIMKYISSESYVINEKLRNRDNLSTTEQKLVNNLDSALEKMPKYEGTVYRSLSLFGIENMQDL